MITVTWINESVLISTGQLQRVMAAIQKQIDRDFYPEYGIRATLILTSPDKVKATQWMMVILDTSDQAAALGYYETTPNGFPLGKVYTKYSMESGYDWATSASHQILEMLANENASATICIQSRGASTLYAQEVCDAVSNDYYLLDGVAVSNFVLNNYFKPDSKPLTKKYDFLGKLRGPIPAITPGGYLLQGKISGTSIVWSQKFTKQPCETLCSRIALLNIPQETRKPSLPDHLHRVHHQKEHKQE